MLNRLARFNRSAGKSYEKIIKGHPREKELYEITKEVGKLFYNGKIIKVMEHELSDGFFSDRFYDPERCPDVTRNYEGILELEMPIKLSLDYILDNLVENYDWDEVFYRNLPEYKKLRDAYYSLFLEKKGETKLEAEYAFNESLVDYWFDPKFDDEFDKTFSRKLLEEELEHRCLDYESRYYLASAKRVARRFSAKKS